MSQVHKDKYTMVKLWKDWVLGKKVLGLFKVLLYIFKLCFVKHNRFNNNACHDLSSRDKKKKSV